MEEEEEEALTGRMVVEVVMTVGTGIEVDGMAVIGVTAAVAMAATEVGIVANLSKAHH